MTKNAQAAKNHCTLQTANGSSIPANKTIVEAGIKMLVTNKSARATFTINALPGIKCVRFFIAKENYVCEIIWCNVYMQVLRKIEYIMQNVYLNHLGLD